jgi:very-short-patch-repair endonuclease
VKGCVNGVTEAEKNLCQDVARRCDRCRIKLWQLLRSRRLASMKFRRQVPIGPWIVDFVSFEQRLIIEADGSQHA